MKNFSLFLSAATALGLLTAGLISAESAAPAATPTDARLVNKQGGAKTRLPNSNKRNERKDSSEKTETALA